LEGLRLDIMFIYFMAICNITHTFGIVYHHWVHFVFICYIFSVFGIMHQEKSGNPAQHRLQFEWGTGPFLHIFQGALSARDKMRIFRQFWNATSRVARFFLVQYTGGEIYQLTTKIPNAY
jgi:hypothetical protein